MSYAGLPAFPEKKNFLFIIGLFLIISVFPSCRFSYLSAEQLEKQLRKEMAGQPGDYALAFQDLQDPSRRILINERMLFHAASTMKTPVLLEVYKQAEAGLFRLEDSIVIKNSFYSIVDSSLYSLDTSSDSEDSLYLSIGKKGQIHDLAYAMITKSSNLATNLLIDLVDAKKVTQSMRALGADSILVLRGVEDLKAFDAGLSNRTNAYDLLLLFEALGRRELVSPEASGAMTDILLDQYYNDIIPAGLPDSVRVAHKTGSITRVMHDSGLIFLPDGRKYALILLSKDWNNEEEARTFLANISYQIYKFMRASG